MGCESKTWLILSLVTVMVASIMQHSTVLGESQVPCIFVFGDSLSDSGNNNNLPTSAKANFLPYGIDFPATFPTGRYSNGRNPIDKIAQLLGFQEFIPPFANLNGSDILKGVNYASGSAGIRKESGSQLGHNVNLGLQLLHHRAIVSRIAHKLGGLDKATQYLSQCLYYVNIGTNDFEQNYFLPNVFNTSRMYTPKQYAKVLIHQLSHYLQTLHHFGARKSVLVGLDRLGCIPKLRVNGSCVEEKNAAVFLFNDQLKSLVDQFNKKILTDSKFIFINSTSIIHDKSVGFAVTHHGCCPTNEKGKCIRDGIPCKNRNEYVFWDGIHTTESANLVTAITSYNSSNPAIAYPTNIKHLVQSNTIN
ncbi:GDSL esterase/lipase At1g29670-like [Lotus japonicus]|uniref:GDSL esterase/lipase At1g29670-like n=1 Tax=Lotus japonicus TaxID=34305 RepID=UPI00258EDEA3|nr:GDSL esterase/lipase At1g29670-like [Lotus japonicus]XP_057450831.1 GDSL esterase/lipase At1g29670-like [Lotus japonicus]